MNFLIRYFLVFLFFINFKLVAEEDYLSKKVYESLIQPVFDAKCVECHGPNKNKGKLKLNTKEDLLKGGTGAGEDILIQGNADDSELIFRITLPSDDDEAMPPMEDKDHYNPVTTQELDVMKSWITLGASFNLLVSELDKKTKDSALHVFKNMPKRILSKSVALQPKLPDVPKANPESLKKIRDAGVLVMPIAQNTNAIYVNASYLGKKFTDKELKLLEPISKQLLWLNLARTAVTDSGAPSIAKHKLLTRLHLENTLITDASSNHLSNLNELEYLNLYGTKISDNSIPHLKNLKKLKKIFLWQTKFSNQGAFALKKHFVEKDKFDELIRERNIKKAFIENLIKSEQDKIKSLEQDVLTASAKSLDKSTLNNKCPVSNKEIDDSIFSIFEGRKVGLCCEKCKIKFNKDGSSYRSKIQNFTPSNNYAEASKELQSAKKNLDQSVEKEQIEFRKISNQLSKMGPEINLGWDESISSNN